MAWRDVFLACLLVFLNYINALEVDYDGQMTMKLEHALANDPNPEFKDRGVIDILSIRNAAVVMKQNVFTDEDRNQLKALSEADGWYLLKATFTSGDSKEAKLRTFVKGCALYESGLSDTLTVSLDHTGWPVGISMLTNPSLCDGRIVYPSDLISFNTTVFIRHMEQGPVPDTATYIQKIEREKEARERGETKDNRSFLAKYWMYIVPVVIFVLLTGAVNPEGAAGGGR
ncbi:ER membrane protein complex subunit 10 [Ischnura elegans]|uniref:ER membrane protein complex subunit 10 n=1 Tax=Ischnura elegans TaxID=197161 RepID=UPI001ED89DA4|nr:ER membrane protein complex subunit 10 [Ischnura elegans]